MDKHPISIWSLGGVPSSDFGSKPSPGDVESWGASWQAASDDYLIGLAARQTGVDAAVAMPALIEKLRRLKESIRDFNEKSGAQAATTIRLTRWIIGLTVALGVIAGLQLWAMLKGGA